MIAVSSLTYIFYYLMYKGKNIKVDKIKEGANYVETLMERQVDNLTLKSKRTKRHISKVKNMLEESSIRFFGKTMKSYFYVLISLGLAFLTFTISNKILNNIIASIILAGVAASIPFEILKLEVQIKRRNVRKNLANFFLMTLQFYETTGDIIEVLDTIILRVKKPLKKPFKEFLTNYKSGKPLYDCKKILQSRFSNPILIRFAEDIENSIENGIRLNGILEEYIMMSYSNEINYMERVTENSGNLSVSMFVFGMFIFFLFQIKKISPDMVNILIYNKLGKVAVVVVTVMLIFAINIVKNAISYTDNN